MYLMENKIEAVNWMYPGQGKIIMGPQKHAPAPCAYKQYRGRVYTYQLMRV
jgi:hypothetical protein